jgi:hypothetical protein
MTKILYPEVNRSIPINWTLPIRAKYLYTYYSKKKKKKWVFWPPKSNIVA